MASPLDGGPSDRWSFSASSTRRHALLFYSPEFFACQTPSNHVRAEGGTHPEPNRVHEHREKLCQIRDLLLGIRQPKRRNLELLVQCLILSSSTCTRTIEVLSGVLLQSSEMLLLVPRQMLSICFYRTGRSTMW